MKKFLASILTLALCLGLATGCAGKQTPAENDTESAGETGVKEIPSLKIAFSPYADADQITTATEPLEQLLQAKLLEKGYDVKDIDMTVGTSYTAVGEALSAGSADIGYAKAKSIALNHAGVSENEAYDMEIELDDEDGTLVYEVEFKSGNMEYDYEINAATGAILKHESELDD